MKPIPSNPLIEATNEVLRLLKSGHAEQALIVLDGELHEHPSINDPKWFRLARAHNWLKNGQSKLAAQVLAENDRWKL